ncbi:MAG: right-handed parallel beta-helix repeat-containing protein [Geobacteraceae bacterium]|nr:right-handed parallel beta-helix repeat-containing protein [Geobacteraceae bacterium]
MKNTPSFPLLAVRFLLFCGLFMLQAGCQQLFHAQDAPLKGQTVTVSMTVPQQPPPAAKPLQQGTEQPVLQKTPQGPLDSRLLPTETSLHTDPLTIKGQADAARVQQKPARTAIDKAGTVLTNKTVAEDMVLRGTVLIKGALVVTPQATLRIDPGTRILFAPAPGSAELSRLVVQGRIVASGTVQQPILFAPALNQPLAGDWGGVVLLNSEKKNSFDHCRIEGAQTGIEAHFSRFTGRGVMVSKSRTGIALYDSEAGLQGCSISRCDRGGRLADSELDLRDSTLQENRQGIDAQRSSFTLSSVKVLNNSQEGVAADQCRFRLTSSQFVENRSGLRLTGGDGQLLLCRFSQNRESGAELVSARIRINSSSFIQNSGVGILLENARGSIVGSVFSENRAGNLHNRGSESFAALLNWWGSADEKQILASIHDPERKNDAALILFAPFLKERPVTAP